MYQTTIKCERNSSKPQSKIQMWKEIYPNMIKYTKILCYFIQLLIRFFSNNHLQLWFSQRPLFEDFKFTICLWSASCCLYSLCTNPHKGLCPYSFKKVLRLQLVLIFNFFTTFFFKSQHITEKNQNKYLTLQLKAVIILNIFWS